MNDIQYYKLKWKDDMAESGYYVHMCAEIARGLPANKERNTLYKTQGRNLVRACQQALALVKLYRLTTQRAVVGEEYLEEMRQTDPIAMSCIRATKVRKTNQPKER